MRLVAVSKFIPAEVINEAHMAGQVWRCDLTFLGFWSPRQDLLDVFFVGKCVDSTFKIEI